MKYNYFKPGDMFYLNGLGCGKTVVSVRNGVLRVKNKNPIITMGIHAQLKKMLPPINIKNEDVISVLDSITDKKMKEAISCVRINDLRGSLTT